MPPARPALVAEVVKYYYPKLIDLHNYAPAGKVQAKVENWNQLNSRVFKKMSFRVEASDIQSLANATPGVIERILRHLQVRMALFKSEHAQMEAHAAATRKERVAQMSQGIPAPTAVPSSVPAASRAAKGSSPAKAKANAVGPGPSGSPAGDSSAARDRQLRDLQETVFALQQRNQQLEDALYRKDQVIASLQQQLGL